MIPPVAWSMCNRRGRISIGDPEFNDASLYYYVFQSTLSPGVFKLGVTSNVARRWLEHGGTQKQGLVRSCVMPRQKALALERSVKTRLHDRRVTDGNELFALDDSHLGLLHAMIDEAVAEG